MFLDLDDPNIMYAKHMRTVRKLQVQYTQAENKVQVWHLDQEIRVLDRKLVFWRQQFDFDPEQVARLMAP